MTTKLKCIILSLILLPTSCLVSGEQRQLTREEKCQVTGFFIASCWHKAAVCSSYYENLGPREKKAKEQIAASYPKLVQAIMTAPWAAEAKESGEDTLYQNRREDPLFSERVCEDPVKMLEIVTERADWKNQLACWK